jgi:hypothetical protein
MMNRLQQILAAVLVVQVVVATALLWPRATTGGVEALLPGVAAEDIVALVIADAQGNEIGLRKASGEWVLPQADDYPAKADTIQSVIDKVLAVDTQRLVTRTTSSHERLQVAAADFSRRVEMEEASGSRHTLYVGSSPSYGATHVRLEGRDETYLTNSVTQYDLGATASSWVDTLYLQVPQEEVVSARLENAHGTVEFSKDAQGNWTLADVQTGEQVDVAEINSVVNRAASLSMLEPLGNEDLPQYGMGSPSAVLTLQKEAEQIKLVVGAQDPSDRSYTVKASTSPYFVRVSEYTVQAMVEDARQDFLQPPPTPTPTE